MEAVSSLSAGKRHPRSADLVCRFCGAALERTFVDLGLSPLANAFATAGDLERGEVFYPLHARVCAQCFLVQLPEYEAPERIFGDYAYFSSYSDTWLEHAKRYVQHMVSDFGVGETTKVVEVGSNDGYLLQYFRQRGVPVLGIEPAANIAAAARRKNIPTVVDFFGVDTAARLRREGHGADLLIANNVLAHVPDLNDFLAGIAGMLEPNGVVTMEFPHLLRLIEEVQFDTIYHEHFSYFSLLTVEQVLAEHGLPLFDVAELPTHGGSLRIYACRADDRGREPGRRLRELRVREREAGIARLETYSRFSARARAAKLALLDFMVGAKLEGKSIAAYGAAAKGTTLLNYCGIGSDFVDFVADRSPHKQGLFVPGVRIPIVSPEAVWEARPDYLLILAWNLRDEIMEQMSAVREYGGRFVVPVPRVEIVG